MLGRFVKILSGIEKSSFWGKPKFIKTALFCLDTTLYIYCLMGLFYFLNLISVNDKIIIYYK